MSEPTLDDARALLEEFERSDMDELRIRSDGFELHAYKSPRPRAVTGGGPAAAPAPASRAEAEPASNGGAPASGSRTRPAEPPIDPAEAWEGMLVIRAPSLGTFYRAPKPGAPPFVTVGQVVEPTTEICIIEVMKLFTAVRAGVRGTVKEILVKDAELVEHDQALLVIEPAAASAQAGT